MTVQNDERHAVNACAIEVSPAEVDAGAEMVVRASIALVEPQDLRGLSVQIRNEDGELVGAVEITGFDGDTNTTDDLRIKAPARAGVYGWTAVAPTASGNNGADISAPFSFTVKAHATSVVVFDVPSTVVAGEPFRVRVGLKCSSGCQPADRPVKIADQEGVERGRCAVSGEPWPGTTSLHVAEVSMKAPDVEGQYRWVANALATEEGLAHAEGSASFGLKVVGQPDCVVTIEVKHGDTGQPIAGATISLPPYRAMTGEDGSAELMVRKGDYTLFVSAPKRGPFRLPISVAGDIRETVELGPNRPHGRE